MNPDVFFENFELFADAPNGVQKLRGLILQLATSGRLTSINEIEKDRHIQRWEMFPLYDVVEILDSKRVPVNSKEREERIKEKNSDELYPYYGATQQVGWIDDYLFDEELVLLGEDGVPFLDPYRPKAYLINGKSWVNNHAHVLRPKKVLGKFLFYFLNIFEYSDSVSGTTRLKLNQSKMNKIIVPVPPEMNKNESSPK